MNHSSHHTSGFGHLPRLILIFSLLVLTALLARAQDGNCVGAPCNLSTSSREVGIELSWNAPVSKDEQNSPFFELTNYLISGLYVEPGGAVVTHIGGSTFGADTSWLDRHATDPELIYMYRVRAHFDGEAGPWSEYVTTGYDWSPPPATPEDSPEPTVASQEPTAPAPTATSIDPFAEFTARARQIEPTAARPEPTATVLTATPDRYEELTAQAPQIEPTAARPEPTATVLTATPIADPPATSETQPATDVPPAPTAVPPRPEPTVASQEPTAPAPTATSIDPFAEFTARARQIEPTAARPEPTATVLTATPSDP